MEKMKQTKARNGRKKIAQGERRENERSPGLVNQIMETKSVGLPMSNPIWQILGVGNMIGARYTRKNAQ